MPSSTSREGWGGWAKKRLNILLGERAGQSGEWTEGETFYWGGGQSWTIPKGWHNRNFRLKWFRLQNIETPLNRWVGRCQITHWSVVQFAHAGGIPGINALRWGWCVKTPKLEKKCFLKLENVSTVHHCPPGEEPCVWSDWGAKGCCWVWDQCGPQEGKACPGQKKIITKVNLIFIILDKYCWFKKYISQVPQLPWMSRSKWVGEPD